MENKRLAVNTGVVLSSNLISACLSMIAIIGAVFFFVIEKREVSWIFYLSISLSFFFFIFSIVLGGKGIDKARKKAFQDVLDLDCSKSNFNLQAIFCLLGIIFCLLSYAFTSEKTNKQSEVKKINENILKVIQLNEDKNNETELLIERIKALETIVNKLETKVNKLETKKVIQKKKTVPNKPS